MAEYTDIKCECGLTYAVSPHDDDWHETGLDEASMTVNCSCGRAFYLDRKTTYEITK